MLNDFDLIQRQIDSKSDVLIYPISDVHLGASEHMEQEWLHFCSEILERPNAFVTLGGDMINNALKSSVSNVYEETMRPREQKRRMTEMLTPIKDRILCAVSGNHERRSGKDSDTDVTYDIMCKLDLEHLYRENMAFVKIQIRDPKQRGHRDPTYTLVVTHGAGGGALTGGAVNRNERFGMVVDGMDCLIVGHTHKPFVTQPSKIVIDCQNNRVSVKPFKVVSSSSWLAYGGYAMSKMLNPSSHAPQIITLHGKYKSVRVSM